MKGETKELIVKSAIQLFSKSGVEETSMRALAKELGISVGNLNYHFPNKPSLLHSICNELIVEIANEIGLVEGSVEDALSKHYRLMKGVFEVQLRYRFLFQKKYGEIVTSIPEVQKYFQRVLVERFSFWKSFHRALVEERMARPEMEEDSVGIAYASNILALFWHQEFQIYHPSLKETSKVDFALSIYFQPIKPYLTKKGIKIYTEWIRPLPSYRNSIKTI